jgi:hypothetical protein
VPGFIGVPGLQEREVATGRATMALPRQAFPTSDHGDDRELHVGVR